MAVILLAGGSLCVLGGVILTLLALIRPEDVALDLPTTATSTPIVPTPGRLLSITVEPPPLPTESVVLMPVMPVVQVESSSTFSPTPSSTPSTTATSSSTVTISPSATATATPRPSSTVTLAATVTRQPSATPSQPPLTASFTPTPRPSLTPDSSLVFPLRPTVSPKVVPQQPARIVIPAIQLDAPVSPVEWEHTEVDGTLVSQWQSPEEYAAGWHNTSAPLGKPGNTVLNGHHNAWGRVFGRLIDVEPGDSVMLYAGSQAFLYTVVQTMLLEEAGQSLEQRLENARWLLASPDERVTLITCWPPSGNSHRLVVIALPSGQIATPGQVPATREPVLPVGS
jgi:sortase A